MLYKPPPESPQSSCESTDVGGGEARDLPIKDLPAEIISNPHAKLWPQSTNTPTPQLRVCVYASVCMCVYKVNQCSLCHILPAVHRSQHAFVICSHILSLAHQSQSPPTRTWGLKAFVTINEKVKGEIRAYMLHKQNLPKANIILIWQEIIYAYKLILFI